MMMMIGMMMEELNPWQIWKVHTSHHGSTKFWIQNIISHYNPFYDFQIESSQFWICLTELPSIKINVIIIILTNFIIFPDEHSTFWHRIWSERFFVTFNMSSEPKSDGIIFWHVRIWSDRQIHRQEGFSDDNGEGSADAANIERLAHKKFCSILL